MHSLYLRPTIFETTPEVVAGFSTRHGGVSTGLHASLNLSLSMGEEAATVHENRRRLFEAIGFTEAQAAFAGQVHGAEVVVVDAPGVYRGVDGMVTQQPGVVLCISAADCAAVLLADAEARVVGACHAGWRGTVARIVVRTMAAMKRLGASPARVKAYVSPCISVANFEVGPEVAAQFKSTFIRQDPGQAKPHVDLKAAVAAQLEDTGIAPAHIEISPRCTMADTDTFFSHRAENARTGRMLGFVGLRG